MKTLTRSLVRHAHAIAREVGARVVLLYADVVEDDQDLADLIQDVDFRVILVSRRSGFQAPEGWGELCAIVRVPDITMTRAGQIKVATLVAAAEGLIRVGDRIVCLTGIDGSGTIDTIIVLDLGTRDRDVRRERRRSTPSRRYRHGLRTPADPRQRAGPGRTRRTTRRHDLRRSATPTGCSRRAINW